MQPVSTFILASVLVLASGCGMAKQMSTPNADSEDKTGATSSIPVIINKEIEISQKPKRDPYDYNIVNPGIIFNVSRRDALQEGKEKEALNKLLTGYLSKPAWTFVSCAEPAVATTADECKVFRVKQKVVGSEWLCSEGECRFDDVVLSSTELQSLGANRRNELPPYIKTSMGYFQCLAAFVGPPVCSYNGLKID